MATKRYTLADVTEIVLTPAGHDRWQYFAVSHVMVDGAERSAPSVNTVAQARQRQRAWFPNARVVIGRCQHCNARQFDNPDADSALNAMAHLCWLCVKPWRDDTDG